MNLSGTEPMIEGEMSKRLVALMGLALVGSQAGHLIAYQARFGAAAQQLQSSGAHAYFPVVVKTAIGAGAIVLVATLLMIGLARALAAGGPVRAAATPSYLSLLAALFTLQLALFMAQEVTEGVVAGVRSDSAINLLLWGTLGQLPVAVMGAAALRWLLGRVEAAAQTVAEAFLSTPSVATPVMVPARLVAITVGHDDWAALRRHQARAPFVKRGPPLSS
jgi:hypothetical protein